MKRVALFLSVAALLLSGETLYAQRTMATVGTPFRTLNHSFFERNGVSWDVRSTPGAQTPWFASFNGAGRAIPPFGGFQQGAGLQGGIGFGGSGFRGNLGFEFSQGASTSMTSQTPSVTLMNGQLGFVADTSQSPFVISVVPVVGNGVFKNYGAANTIYGRLARGEIHLDESGRVQPGPNRELPQLHPRQPKAKLVPKQPPRGLPRQAEPPRSLTIKSNGADDLRPFPSGGTGGESTAEQATLSLDEILKQKAALESQQQAKALEYLEQGKEAAAEGKANVARIYYKMAFKRARGELKQQIQSLLSE